MMSKTEKQKAAMKFTSDYLSHLGSQEMLIERAVARKWNDLQPEIERLIEQKVKECVSQQDTKGHQQSNQ